jgi:hypothetical protein
MPVFRGPGGAPQTSVLTGTVRRMSDVWVQNRKGLIRVDQILHTRVRGGAA